MADTVIWGSTKEKHDLRLQEVLEATRAANFKSNRAKCMLGITDLTFIGDIISAEGVKPDKTIKAIEMMPHPQSKEIQWFLGIVNFLGKFIPNLAGKTPLLRTLLENKQEWCWNEEQEESQLVLKQKLMQELILKLFTPEKPIKMLSDASQSGVRAVILQ